MGSRSQFQVELEQEEDGPWIAEVSALPGVMAYGSTRGEALAPVQALTLRVLADRLEHRKTLPDQCHFCFLRKRRNRPTDARSSSESHRPPPKDL